MQRLRGMIAVVTGASRGGGRGIALVLGEEGATVYVTGNIPPNGRPSPEEMNRTESVEYIGRAVVALVTDPSVMEKSGSVLTVGDLAREYGFTDIDGRQVSPFRVSEEYRMD